MKEKLRLMLFYRLLKSLNVKLVGGHWLYTPYLTNKAVVVDGGANKGNFSIAILKAFSCTCFAIEPVLSYLQQIEAMDGLKKVHGALSDRTGEMDFFISDQLEASSLISIIPEKSGNIIEKVKVHTFSWASFIKQFGITEVDLLKLDIEGAEVELINQMTDDELIAIPQIIVEFHDFVFPQQKTQIRSIVERLKQIGFLVLFGSRNHLMDMIFLNKNMLHFSYSWQIIYKVYKIIEFKRNHLYLDNY